MGFKKTARLLFLLGLILSVAGISYAGEISDRTTLESILGSNAVTEDFETLPVPSSTAWGFYPAVDELNSTSIITNNTINYGPGLVVPGIRFINMHDMNWFGPDIWGQTSRGILSFNYDGIVGHSMSIDFVNPTPAFGMDLSNIYNIGAPSDDIYTIRIYGADDLTLLDTSAGIPIDQAIKVFYGYSNESGIGKIDILSAKQEWSPALDNITFASSVVPEPVSSILFLFGAGSLGALAFRRKKQQS